MNEHIQKHKLSMKPFDDLLEPTEDEWMSHSTRTGKWYGLNIAKATLMEIDDFLAKKKDMRKSAIAENEIPTPLVDVALKVLQNYNGREERGRYSCRNHLSQLL